MGRGEGWRGTCLGFIETLKRFKIQPFSLRGEQGDSAAANPHRKKTARVVQDRVVFLTEMVVLLAGGLEHASLLMASVSEELKGRQTAAEKAGGVQGNAVAAPPSLASEEGSAADSEESEQGSEADLSESGSEEGPPSVAGRNPPFS